MRCAERGPTPGRRPSSSTSSSNWSGEHFPVRPPARLRRRRRRPRRDCLHRRSLRASRRVVLVGVPVVVLVLAESAATTQGTEVDSHAEIAHQALEVDTAEKATEIEVADDTSEIKPAGKGGVSGCLHRGPQLGDLTEGRRERSEHRVLEKRGVVRIGDRLVDVD